MTIDPNNLKTFVQFASAQAELIFKKTGELLPMYHAITSKGEHLFIMSPPVDDKDLAVAMVKMLFEEKDVDTYCFMAEAWMLTARQEQVHHLGKFIRQGLATHPDRREIIAFSAENRDGHSQTAARFILRPEFGKPKLAPLVMDDMTDRLTNGRLVGLLRGRLQ